MNKVESIIRGGVERCDYIVAGINELKPFLRCAAPFDWEQFAVEPVIERIASIAMLKRFERLQDMTGRLFRAYLSWEGEDVREMSRRDQANYLEKLRLVTDADDWMDLLDLRNRLVHEYPITATTQEEAVDETWSATTRLISIYQALRRRIQDRNIP